MNSNRESTRMGTTNKREIYTNTQIMNGARGRWPPIPAKTVETEPNENHIHLFVFLRGDSFAPIRGCYSRGFAGFLAIIANMSAISSSQV